MALLTPYFDSILLFVLVLTRVSGLVMTAPVFGSQSMPRQVRAFLAIGMALIVTPWFWGTSLPEVSSLVDLLLLVGRELTLGLILGLSVIVLFGGMQLAGQIMGQMSGLQLSEVFDPTFEVSVPVFGRLLDLVTVALFLILGGHRELTGALLDSFVTLPPGPVRLPDGLVDTLTYLVTSSFVVGVRMAAPAMVALLLATIVTGLISRTLTQLNFLAVGFQLNLCVMLGTLLLSLGTVAYVFEDQAFAAIEAARAWIESHS